MNPESQLCKFLSFLFQTVLTPGTPFYTKLGQDCVAAGCSVDLFLFPNQYVDVATIGEVCRLTGGQIYKYTYFKADVDGDRFIGDVRNNVSRPVAFDAIMRVRTSTGRIQVPLSFINGMIYVVAMTAVAETLG